MRADPSDNQGRGDAQQLPECSGIVLAAVIGLTLLLSVLEVFL